MGIYHMANESSKYQVIASNTTPCCSADFNLKSIHYQACHRASVSHVAVSLQPMGEIPAVFMHAILIALTDANAPDFSLQQHTGLALVS
eukprot:scaffold413725_cov44-Prasinocladus_malaysianus.AAC.1